MSSYTAFAEFYDYLTNDVDYDKRAEYFCRLLERRGHSMGLTLDLACGTGSLTIALAKRGVDVYGIDASPSMLTVAQEKAAQANTPILFLCQRMEELDLFGTVDTVICTLDSINHLTEEKAVLQAFERVALFLEPNGYFVFDVNTPYKHRHILGSNTFLYDTDHVYCVWQNTLDEETGVVEINLDFFARQEKDIYRRSGECFYERPYDSAEIQILLERAGMELVDIYNDMTFTPASPEQERWVVVARKMREN